MLRLFQLHRQVDVTGVSGTGVVAEGVQFTDGSVVIRWFGEHASTVNWACIEHAEHVHGHGGNTRFVWLDDLVGGRPWQNADTCDACQAQPGEPCREADGRQAQVPHRVRRWTTR